MEDYLEAISGLEKKNRVARVGDISRLLNVKTPSVTAALDNLSKNGFVVHQRYGYVQLTPQGRKVAETIEKRHEMLVKFLIEILDINPRLAKEDACKIEHSLSKQSSEKLAKFIEFVKSSPDSNKPTWLENFHYYFKRGK